MSDDPRFASRVTRGRLRRWAALGAVGVVLVGAGLLDHFVTRSSGAQPAVAVDRAASARGTESSTWYCAGGNGASDGIAPSKLYLTNTTPRAVAGSVGVVNDSGATRSVAISVAAHRQQVFDPLSVLHGTWLANRVDLAGGGVVVSEAVHGPTGWAQSPCASETAPDWYFAAGATGGPNLLAAALYNPTATSAVVDLTFVIGSGVTEPAPFQGLVVAPGQLVVVDIGSHVQNEGSVSTVARARSGRIVAFELQTYFSNGVHGMSLRLGSPTTGSEWVLPRSFDIDGGATSVAIFNPTASRQEVTVEVQLPSGPVAPFTNSVGPQSTWNLQTSSASRIPANVNFALTVSANGPGVVVERTTQAPSSAVAPQWGEVPAEPASVFSAPARYWVIPAPGVAGDPIVAGAASNEIALENPTRVTVTVTVSALTTAGPRSLGPDAVVRIGPRGFIVIPSSVVQRAAPNAIVVRASGPVAIEGDQVPAGLMGVVAIGGVPLSP